MIVTHKKCPTCGETKPAGEYCLDNSKKDKLFYNCKECKKKVSKSYYAKNRDRILRQAAAWRVTYAGKKSQREKNARYYKKYPKKLRAHARIRDRVQSGKMPPAKSLFCSALCGRKAVHYHHQNGYDLEYVYDVVPLCWDCHREEHRTKR